jgi:beta-lactamase superfamily II metal-dependent hydrolase
MGRTKYGDSIVVQCAGKNILIDGGHPGDDKDRDDRPSIPAQLEGIFGRTGPFHFDLLVVTHCHSDHIGCLPKLVASNVLICDRALVADEKLGFGLDAEGGGDARLASVGSKARSVIAALSEEDHSSLRGGDLEQFLSDAATLQDNYNGMLRTLARNADLVRYRQGTQSEQEQVRRLVAELADTGLKIYGPTADQLVHCAETIQRGSGDVADMLADGMDAAESAAETYLRLMAGAADPLGADRASRAQRAVGFAKNCQSIVVALGEAGARALLPGDMQFADPGIREIEDSVQQLRRDIAADAPYAFVKLPHHSSDNGTDDHLLEEWQWPPLLGHSGGYKDGDHPNPNTLNLLKSSVREHSFSYGRTDHNGIVTVHPAAGEISPERGRLNDFTPNEVGDEAEEAAQPPPATPLSSAEEAVTVARPSADSFVEIVFARIPYLDGRVSINDRVIEISRPRVPVSPPARPRPSPDPQPSEPERPSPVRPSPRAGTGLAGGRALPPLLFVTDPARLKENIGQDADTALGIVRRAGQRLVTGAGEGLAEATRRAILESAPKGVVLLGGYDVVPSQRVDVLDAELRTGLGNQVGQDRDGFIVWSDDVYGDRDRDGVAELPVSRVPDARLGSFFLSLLTGVGVGRSGKFGVRNRARPFAEAIYNSISGNGVIQISAPQGPEKAQQALAARESAYFMLHGDYRDSTTFWGEDDSGVFAAIDVRSVPASGVGIAFAGCCWGALTVSEPAFLSPQRPTPRMVERSMALSLLKAGAKAFVGVTGVHYSPTAAGNFFGGPLHAAFWREIGAGNPPALALFNARQSYVREIPHGRPGLWNLAVERKLYKQFTCLGLGW